MSEKLALKDVEAAELFGLKRSAFRENVRKGILPQPVKIGGATRWRVSDLQRHLQAMPTTTP